MPNNKAKQQAKTASPAVIPNDNERLLAQIRAIAADNPELTVQLLKTWMNKQ